MSSFQLNMLEQIDAAFSNTPTVVITTELNGIQRKIYGKYEAVTLTGSAKDRMARYIIKDAYKLGKIKQGDCIIETSSGNAGIALSAVGAMLGNPVVVFIPDWLSEERYKMLELYGAKIVKVGNQEGGFNECSRRTKELSGKDGYFAPNQFGNEKNVEAQFNTTITELFTTLSKIGAKPTSFVAGYGTGGVVLAANRMIKQIGLECKAHPLEPSSMPLISSGRANKLPHEEHKIEGIVDDFIPPLMIGKALDSPVVIDQDEAIRIARRINKMGLSFGISSGANLIGCLQQLNEYGGTEAATVFCDGCTKYYSTDLFSQSFQEESDGLASKVKILGIDIIK